MSGHENVTNGLNLSGHCLDLRGDTAVCVSNQRPSESYDLAWLFEWLFSEIFTHIIFKFSNSFLKVL